MDGYYSSSAASSSPRDAPLCEYCGAPLNPNFYFCLSCATPYQSEERVLPTVRPPTLTTELRVKHYAPHVYPLFWAYFIGVLGPGIACFFIFGEDNLVMMFLVQSIVILCLTCFFAFFHWPSLAVQLRRFGFLSWSAWAGLALLAPLLALNYGYHYWLVNMGDIEIGMPIEKLRESGFMDVELVIYICILPAFNEEIAFRGLLQHWLQAAISPWKAIAIASALFTVLHFSAVSAPYLILVGALLGWVKWRTGSLYPSILIHFLHNFVALFFFDFS